jgi:hypothetical protein
MRGVRRAFFLGAVAVFLGGREVAASEPAAPPAGVTRYVGKLVGFETTFTINRRDFGVLGSKWGAVPGVLGDDVEIHIVVGGIRPASR